MQRHKLSIIILLNLFKTGSIVTKGSWMQSSSFRCATCQTKVCAAFQVYCSSLLPFSNNKIQDWIAHHYTILESV